MRTYAVCVHHNHLWCIVHKNLTILWINYLCKRIWIVWKRWWWKDEFHQFSSSNLASPNLLQILHPFLGYSLRPGHIHSNKLLAPEPRKAARSSQSLPLDWNVSWLPAFLIGRGRHLTSLWPTVKWCRTPPHPLSKLPFNYFDIQQ